METAEEAIRTLRDKQAIAERIFQYCRAIDRVDAALLEDVYWPDAVHDHGSYQGGAAGLAEYLFPSLKISTGQHVITNVLIEMRDASHALCESYVHVHQEKVGPPVNAGGRYYDLFEKRGKEWRIARRTVLIDYSSKGSGLTDWARVSDKATRNRGRKFPDDKSYHLYRERI